MTWIEKTVYQKIYEDGTKLEHEVNMDDYIKKSKIIQKLDHLKDIEEELTDEQGYWGSTELLEKIELLEEILDEN